MRTMFRSGIVALLLVLLILPLLAACSDDDGTPASTPEITESPASSPAPTGEPTAESPTGGAIVETNEPPANPFLADSAWPMAHRNSYQQGSSPYPGPTEPPTGEIEDFLQGRPATITANFSGLYPDGGRVIWASNYGQVFKADPEGNKLGYIDIVESEPVQWLPDELSAQFAEKTCQEVADIIVPMLPQKELREGEAIEISGIYPIIDNENDFYQALGKRIVVYGDQIEGDRFSPIEVKREFEIPQEELAVEWDKIIGFNITYDGMLAFATNYGLVGVIDRFFENARYLQLGNGDEHVFNSIAVDEDGGIYVATHKKMYRVQWTGEKLTIDENEGGWSAGYETGMETAGSQMATGAGATPSLMGAGDHDKFVVITDGQPVMHVVLFWRDQIPDDWEQIPGTKDRRIAAQVSIKFGLEEPETSWSEQSVLVRGYGAFVVNNELTSYTNVRVEDSLLSGEPGLAPYGCEKFEWDPQIRELKSDWANQDVSFPNAIPTMSSATNLVYQIGQRNGVWTMEALDWDTGEVAFTYEIGDRSRHNSYFAAIQVGPDGDIYYGTFLGLIRIKP